MMLGYLMMRLLTVGIIAFAVFAIVHGHTASNEELNSTGETEERCDMLSPLRGLFQYARNIVEKAIGGGANLPESTETGSDE
ncbi:hypothetical protein MTO96_037784 [Rhipicephalus appendiculatus]